MKRLFFWGFFLATIPLSAQFKYSVLYNLGQLPYQCFEVDLLMCNQSEKLQLLLGFNYTLADINNNRKPEAFDERYQKSLPEHLKGPGYAAQFRFFLNGGVSAHPVNLLMGIGINQYFYKGFYFSNEYVQNPPFYHYQLIEHSYKFIRTNIGPQFIISSATRRIHWEIGVGAYYAFANVPEDVQKNRNLNLSVFDYGYNGIAPSINFKLGYQLFKAEN